MAKFIRIAGESLLPEILPERPVPDVPSEPVPDVPQEWTFHDLVVSRAPEAGRRAWRVDSPSTVLPDGFVRWATQRGYAVRELPKPSPKAARTILLAPSGGEGKGYTKAARDTSRPQPKHESF